MNTTLRTVLVLLLGAGAIQPLSATEEFTQESLNIAVTYLSQPPGERVSPEEFLKSHAIQEPQSTEAPKLISQGLALEVLGIPVTSGFFRPMLKGASLATAAARSAEEFLRTVEFPATERSVQGAQSFDADKEIATFSADKKLADPISRAALNRALTIGRSLKAERNNPEYIGLIATEFTKRGSVVKEVTPKPASEDGLKFDGPTFLTHAGLRMIAPYTLQMSENGKHLLLSSDSTQVKGFAEVAYLNLWVARREKIESSLLDATPMPSGGANTCMASDHVARKNVRSVLTDRRHYSRDSNFIARLSFMFGQNEEFSPTSVTGSGAFAVEMSYDAHIAQGFHADSAWSLGLGATGGAVTDRGARTVHPHFIYGPYFTMMRDRSFAGGVKRPTIFRLGIGGASVRGVEYDRNAYDTVTDEAGNTQQEPVYSAVHFDRDSKAPIYRRQSGWAADAELLFPIDDGSGTITVGARCYGDVTPSPWTVYLAYQVDIFGALGKLFRPEKD